MAENFEVAQSSSEGELSDAKRHEVVAAQLRGEAKAAGQGPEAVVAAVAEELERIGVEPDPAELSRRYEQTDPDLPESSEAEGGPAGTAHDAPADAGTGGAAPDPGADGPVSAGVDAGRDHSPVGDADGDPAR